MAAPPPSQRFLASTCYDGHVIRTHWNAHDHWMLAPQFHQAEMHRDRVLAYLGANRLRRLRTWEMAA